MGRRSQQGTLPHFLWLPGELFELGFDPRLGVVDPPPGGTPALIVTSHRAIWMGQQAGKRTISLIPLDRVSAVEVIDVVRPGARLAQGVLFLGIGVLLGLLSWVVLEVFLLVLIAGGLPTLVGVYMLAGYAFPDEPGELLVHSTGHTLRVHLLSAVARHDAYTVAHRMLELMLRVPGGVAEPAASEAAAGPASGPDAGTQVPSAIESASTMAVPVPWKPADEPLTPQGHSP
jgi:hypothetical protein